MKRIYLIAYIVWGIAVLLFSYMVPYVILAKVSDVSLYIFWLALTLIHFIVSYLYLKRGVENG